MHAGLALWVTDRLYEANAEEMISGIGDDAMAVPDAGKWTALAVLIGVRLGWAARRFFEPIYVQVQAAQLGKAKLEPPTVESASRYRRESEELARHIIKVCPPSCSSTLSVICQAFMMISYNCLSTCKLSNTFEVHLCSLLRQPLPWKVSMVFQLLPVTHSVMPAHATQLVSASVAAGVVQKLTHQKRADVVIATLRRSVETAALGSSFILTGNLLAPWVGAVTCDLLFSYYQRSKYQMLKSRIEQHVKSFMAEVTSGTR